MLPFTSETFARTEIGDADTEVLFSSVLLIEDDPAHARLIQRALEGVVGEIRHVSSGAQGLTAVQEEFCELVFCDLHLPDMTGTDVVRSITRARPGLPVIIITSSNKLEDAVRAMREGAWDFVVKHFAEDLRGQMRLIVQRAAERKLQQIREIRLRAERDAFSVAAFTAQDGLAILSEAGVVVFANQAFSEFGGLIGAARQPGEEVLNLVDAIAQQNFAVARELHRELASATSNALWSSEVELSSGAGDEKRPRNFELTLSTVSFGNLEELPLSALLPRMRYHVIWIRDITRRKEQERFQRDLLSTTTHDLKGPLAAILTSAELLSETGCEPLERAMELLTRIASCARSSISIIDELLSARRIQDGVLVVKPRWYHLAEILEDVLLDYLPMAKAKSIQFQLKPVDPELQIFADRIGLNRVLGNLVSNALKFTPKGGKVKISAERRVDAVSIKVADSGPGIEAAARHKLFERFSRLEQHAEFEGTGLGLFVSKNIVDAHGGNIELRSKVGSGTAFIVTLPDEGHS